MNWDNRFAARTRLMKRSAIREILKLTAQPDVISFAGGLPAPELFPIERIQEATDTVLSERGREVLQYSTTEGMPELRQFIARWIPSQERGIANGWIFAGVGAGAGLSPPLITYLMLNYGWRASFWVCSALGLIAGAVWYLLARDTPADHPPSKYGPCGWKASNASTYWRATASTEETNSGTLFSGGT